MGHVDSLANRFQLTVRCSIAGIAITSRINLILQGNNNVHMIRDCVQQVNSVINSKERVTPEHDFRLGVRHSHLGTSDRESRTTGVIHAYDTAVMKMALSRRIWTPGPNSTEVFGFPLKFLDPPISHFEPWKPLVGLLCRLWDDCMLFGSGFGLCHPRGPHSFCRS